MSEEQTTPIGMLNCIQPQPLSLSHTGASGGDVPGQMPTPGSEFKLLNFHSVSVS